MEGQYFEEVKKLIDVYNSIQEKNSALLDVIQQKTTEIEKLKQSELKLKNHMKNTLYQVVNSVDICKQYTTLKEKFENLSREKGGLVEQHEKQILYYQDMLTKEQEKYKLKEWEFNNEIKKSSCSLQLQEEQLNCRWKNLLDEANRKLKESNISCNNLRAQLHQLNQKLQWHTDAEKRIRELENKLDFKENELRNVQQLIYTRNNSPPSPPISRTLYRTKSKRGTYVTTTKQTQQTSSTRLQSKRNSFGGTCAEYVQLSTTNITIKNTNNLPPVIECTPAKQFERKPAAGPYKKRKLFDPKDIEVSPDGDHF